MKWVWEQREDLVRGGEKREEGVITVEARGRMLCEREQYREQKRGKSVGWAKETGREEVKKRQPKQIKELGNRSAGGG